MACITATVTIPTISATASVPTYGAEVNVDLRSLLPRAHLARVADSTDCFDPNNILTLAEDVPEGGGGVRLGVSGAAGCNTPETGATISIPLRDVSGREIGPIAQTQGRTPFDATFFIEELEGWANKALPSKGSYWIGLCDGPFSEGRICYIWGVENTEAGTQRLYSWVRNADGSIGTTVYGGYDARVTSAVGSYGGLRGWQPNQAYNVRSVVPMHFGSPGEQVSGVSVQSPSGTWPFYEGANPHLVIGAGCDGVGDEIEIRGQAIAIDVANPDKLVPTGTPPTYVPARRVFPAFESAIASADPNGLIAEAVDLPNGAKRISFNPTTVDSGVPTEGAWWVWPWEDVLGRTDFEDVDLLDLRHWDGRFWLEMLVPPASRPTGWWVACGLIHGSEVTETNNAIMGGYAWPHSWGYPQMHQAFRGDGASWNIDTGAIRTQDVPAAELNWGIRGQWIYGVHTNGIVPGGQHYSPYLMAGGGAISFDARQAAGEDLHLVLAVGHDVDGGAPAQGVADSMVIRPCHNLLRKRY